MIGFETSTTMATDRLLKPTLHVEVLVLNSSITKEVAQEICTGVSERLLENYVTLKVGQEVSGFDGIKHENLISRVEMADFTGRENSTGFYRLQDVQLDVQVYDLKPESEIDPRRRISQFDEEGSSQIRVLQLPNVTLEHEWNSLVFDEALPARLLRYLVRMVGMMSRPGLNLSTFNWNRLCLLHGPPGSGKSTLCRALAQKLSIRLGNIFPKAVIIEINTNAMLSKYFSESGRLVGSTFDKICKIAQNSQTLVVVVMDEVETIAGSRKRATSSMECTDGLRATNQLLTALDRLRNLPNAIVLCTSNLVEAIDPAFLDRVDIKQLIPCPSPAAIYNIFRSCLNELLRIRFIDPTAPQASPRKTSTSPFSSSQKGGPRRSSRGNPKTTVARATLSRSPEPRAEQGRQATIPTFSETMTKYINQAQSPGQRVWGLAQKCDGFSGRTLRRLPILGLAMYTWGGQCSLEDALTALEAAVDQELVVAKDRDVQSG